ncbi:FAD-dependent oxidoreductase [Streptomyces cremeus]|uniref:FAD-dependent oxidoreductase n=1 Tax=Streptomyces cremeus TaxID=66881 RepID=A0ABV5PJ15_STRCM
MTTSVLIVGSGPTGLTLALDLARRGVSVRVVDKSPEFPRSSRAKGPNQRSLEVLEDLGVVRAVLDGGRAPVPMRKYRDGLPVADADPWAGRRPTPDVPYDRGWLLAQWKLEEILRDRLAAHGVRVELGVEIVSYEQSTAAVLARTAGGQAIEARYLVGCDGGRSRVRKLMGATFEGDTREEQVMVTGDVALTGADGLSRDHWHQWFDEDGAVMLCPIPGTAAHWWFQAGPERAADGTPVPPSRDGFQRLLDRHARLPGVTLTEAALLSTYRVNVRMADRFRAGRALLAGDAAHVHPIAGGLGMNTGIQDAYNLGWKLAAVATGRADEALLDTYEEERLPVAARTLDLTSRGLDVVLAAIKRPGGGLDVGITDAMSGLGVGYRWSSLAPPTTVDTPLRPGDRAPDAPCADARTGAPVRLFEVFAGPHVTLLAFGARAARALPRRSDRLHAYALDAGPRSDLADTTGHARTAYGITGDALVLVRPDNHVALIADPSQAHAVRDCLHTLGEPSGAPS